MSEDKIISCSDIMLQIVDSAAFKNRNLPSVWKSVVSKVKSGNFTSENSDSDNLIGERLAGNTRVVDLKNGVLLIETDHSGWIQYLKMYQKFILKGLKMALPDLEIKGLAFRLAGSNAMLSESYEQRLHNDMEKMNQKIEKEEEALKEHYQDKKSNKKGTLPPELLEKFESIKNTMLTNSEK